MQAFGKSIDPFPQDLMISEHTHAILLPEAPPILEHPLIPPLLVPKNRRVHLSFPSSLRPFETSKLSSVPQASQPLTLSFPHREPKILPPSQPPNLKSTPR